jgi:site-specific DNA recombinase
MTRAAVYARISEDRDETKLGVARQRKDCESLADRKGWTVVDTYIDNDISAFSGKARPSYSRLLEDIKARQIDAVVVWHLDRLHRQPKELEEFIDVCESRGIQLASVSGRVDLSTPEGRLHARILGAVARMESEHKSRRIRRKMLELAQAGKPKGGKRPYGFERDQLTINEIEAAVIREAAQRVLAGDGLRSLCIDFNARGITTATGKKWAPVHLRQILKSARIAGQREHQGSIIGPALWQPIVTPAESARLRALFTDRARRNLQPPRRNVLVGVVRCGLCGANLVGRPRNGKRMYICSSGPGFKGCGRIGRLAEPIDDLITEAVLYRIDTPAVAQALAAATDPAGGRPGLGTVDADQAQLDELARAYAEKKISMNEWLIARDPIERRITEANVRLAEQTRHSALAHVANAGGSLRQEWTTLSLERRRAVISTVLDHVLVHPAAKGVRRFDPSRIEPVWRL